FGDGRASAAGVRHGDSQLPGEREDVFGERKRSADSRGAGTGGNGRGEFAQFPAAVLRATVWYFAKRRGHKLSGAFDDVSSSLWRRKFVWAGTGRLREDLWRSRDLREPRDYLQWRGTNHCHCG